MITKKTYDSYFNKPYNRVYVKTQCDCGKIPESNYIYAIKSGHVKSCGCSKFNNPVAVKDLTGRKFGRLTVIGRDLERDSKLNSEGKKGTHWLCRCDCGNPKLSSVVGYQLTSGRTQSCGCYASEQIAKRNKRVSTKINKYIDNRDGTITLLDDSGSKCLIDEEDYPVVKRWYWRKISKRGNIEKGYWVTNVKNDDKYNKSVLMIHQVIAEIKYGEYGLSNMVPDHLSRDTSDNRKCNIILKSNQNNSHNRGRSKTNTSGKTGVNFLKDRGLWVAYITVNYKNIWLGEFVNYEDAVTARKRAEEKYGFTCDEVVADYDGKVG